MRVGGRVIQEAALRISSTKMGMLCQLKGMKYRSSSVSGRHRFAVMCLHKFSIVKEEWNYTAWLPVLTMEFLRWKACSSSIALASHFGQYPWLTSLRGTS